MLLRVLSYTGFAILASCAACAQTAEPLPRFEGADVQTDRTSPLMDGPFNAGGLFKLRSATMVDLIHIAYNVEPDRVLGGPNWLELDRFDITAKMPPGNTPESRRLMLRALLEDRFDLVAHPGTQPMRASALTAGPHPQLKPADTNAHAGCGYFRPDPPGPTATTMILKCHNMSMAELAEQVRNLARQGRFYSPLPVVDRTELRGGWDFDVQYDPQLAPLEDNGYLSQIFSQQLGLKLVDVRIPAPVIEVVRVNRTPTPNPPDLATIIPPLPAEFDAAEVKPADMSPDARRQWEFKNGRVYIPQTTVEYLIRTAWSANREVVGMPKWAQQDQVDFIAKAPPEISIESLSTKAGFISLDIEPLRPLLRSFLTERYKVKVHAEDRPAPGYALVAVKPKLTKADPAARINCHDGPLAGSTDSQPRPGLGRLVTCQNVTMAQFAKFLLMIPGAELQGPVSDNTGLEGAWQFSFHFASSRQVAAAASRNGDEPADPAGQYTIFDALSKELGLKLESRKQPMPVLVVDYIEQ